MHLEVNIVNFSYILWLTCGKKLRDLSNLRLALKMLYILCNILNEFLK